MTAKKPAQKPRDNKFIARGDNEISVTLPKKKATKKTK